MTHTIDRLVRCAEAGVPETAGNVIGEQFLPIDLMRHGETEGGPRYRSHTDDPLTAVGWAQMWAAVDVAHRWESIVTSPLARCADFARALAQRHAIPLRVDERLREMNFGAWEGRTAADLMTIDANSLTRFWQDPWNNGPPGGEPLEQVRSRVFAAWEHIIAQGRPTLLVTHGGPIRLILCRCLPHPFEKLLEIEVPHAALHRLQVRDSGSTEQLHPTKSHRP